MAKNRIIRLSIISLSLLIMVTIFGGCASSKIETPTTAEGVFNAALMQFKDENWQEAQRLFDIIKLQYPATVFADDAQFYLAEINFKRKEYILAAFNYNNVRRIYNRSEYSKEALYKTGLSYYMMSPTYDRDQENTLKAIQVFSEFMAIYPGDTLATEAESKIIDLRNKLGEKEFQSGEIYRKLENLKSALFYYNSVIDNYADTEAAEAAFIAKMEVLKEIKKSQELKSTQEVFEKTYPNTRFAKEYEAIKK